MMMWGWLLIPVVLVWVIFQYNRRNRQNTVKRENPMDILDNRFAKGEISKAKYEQQRQTLNSKN
jgi:putative membrane protein